MKRILALALVLAGCGAPEIEITTARRALGGEPTAAAADTARDDGSSNPMPGRPSTATAPQPTATAPGNPAASNPMPGAPAPIADPLAPGSSNPMPGVTAVVDYTR
ncbi:MAG: hypothetical protein ACXVDD_15850 [Polyangia bacterium]